jgi:UDP-N-acetylmuramyl pentapeptide phosphotransferase/UDP-N-acetylglucosamine-1-phosphate transferase
MDPAYLAVVASALGSFLMAGLLVLTAEQHGRFTMDAPGAIQKFHVDPTPRIGGVGIYLALVGASLLVLPSDAKQILETILLAGIPALLVGLLEDLTKKVTVSARLLATMASGLAACWLSGVVLNDVDVQLVDQLLRFTPLAALFTAFAVGGVANAINIIDGFHGLASGTATICLMALAGIAALAGDPALALTAVVIAAAVTGFWLVNFPWGKLFLGDGGAYFAGFALAWLAVLLPIRNPSVSPWASFLVCAYPIIEVVYSIVRRRRGRQSPGHADRRHLHSLVATQFVLRRFTGLNPTLQNATVSVIMWCFASVPAAAALALYRRTDLLVYCAIACVVAYHFIYRRIIRK